MKISLGCDHAGFEYKEKIKAVLADQGYEIEDFGTYSDDPCDYPDYIRPAAQAVADGKCGRGIVLGGSGNGEAIVSNKLKGVRCAVCWDLYTAEYSRRHNDANVLSIGQRTVSLELALSIVDLWLKKDFDGGRHKKRIDKIEPVDPVCMK